MDYVKRSELDMLLEGIQKPGRYIGNETGIKSKSLTQIEQNNMVLAALAFPDVYEMGMANLGMQILYDTINRRPDFHAERVYAPWMDFEQSLKQKGCHLFSLENRILLKDFHFIGFSLAHELLYSNMLNMIHLAGLKVRANQRQGFPLIGAGGPAAANPQPVSAFLDFVVIGEAEELILEIMARIQSYRAKHMDKQDMLTDLSRLEGIYVPGMYRFYYHRSGKIQRIEPQKQVRKRIFENFSQSSMVRDPVVPNIHVVHDRLAAEIMRGCPRQCRFCQARCIYHPLRARKEKDLAQDIISGLKCTGYDELSLLSLSTADYKGLENLMERLKDYVMDRRISISLPSLRMESFSSGVEQLLGSGRKTGLTFAPEAGSRRMRKIIGKDMTQETLIRCIRSAFSKGWEKIKLYFMIGFPFEEDADILAIAALIQDVVHAAKAVLPAKRFRRLKIGVSVNAMVPKPHTPFQWAAQDSPQVLETKFSMLVKNVPKRAVKLNWTDPQKSRLEAALARGDARLCDVVEQAWRNGARFDNWTDLFDLDAWMKAFAELELPVDFYANRIYGQDEILPWDMIHMGIEKKVLLKQYQKAQQYAAEENSV